jgi:hypothetical protein
VYQSHMPSLARRKYSKQTAISHAVYYCQMSMSIAKVHVYKAGGKCPPKQTILIIKYPIVLH